MLPRTFRALACLALLVPACASAGDPGDQTTELAPGPAPTGDRPDLTPAVALPVAGDYAATAAGTVTNQWEDTTTPDALAAGIAWPANSGLNWDQKYAAWIGSFQQIPNIDSSFTTISISTPFGKSVPGPKLDCADLAILFRFSFAAWYHLPVVMVGYDGATPVFFGHFGVRTTAGQWRLAPAFAQYADDSTETAAQYGQAWPQDTKLRTLGVSAGDDLPFLGAGAREGAFLDEIHLNKRAARLVLFAQEFLGSHNMVDNRNTYNLVPAALRTGDVLMFARSPTVDGHTTIVTSVTTTAGQMQAQSVYGNDPPAQPMWQDPSATLQLFTDVEGGGPVLNTPYGGTTLYSHLNGGLKRWRVAKAQGGNWVNTWMDADSASSIADTDYDAIGARPAEFAVLLGSSDPRIEAEDLVETINAKRTYLDQHPSSCAARIDREAAFAQLYQLEATAFGQTQAQVDAQYRTIEDYVFPPLDYAHSPTCCWDNTDNAMTQVILAYETQQQASGCVAPTPFEMTAGGYDPFTSFATSSGKAADWTKWSADEECDQAAATADVPIAFTPTPFCQLSPPVAQPR